jgi:hypothetical protein
MFSLQKKINKKGTGSDRFGRQLLLDDGRELRTCNGSMWGKAVLHENTDARHDS